jgi:hypothetical protein
MEGLMSASNAVFVSWHLVVLLKVIPFLFKRRTLEMLGGEEEKVFHTIELIHCAQTTKHTRKTFSLTARCLGFVFLLAFSSFSGVE